MAHLTNERPDELNAPVARERPILFSAPMVRAILDGRKTQTRRIIKPAPEVFDYQEPIRPEPRGNGGTWIFMAHSDRPSYQFATSDRRCPYGVPGDRLWVRETFVTGYEWDTDRDKLMAWDADGNALPEKVWYRATVHPDFFWTDDDGGRIDSVPWKPSIHMPRCYSRITLEITDVRVQRLQDISEQDAIAEGIYSEMCPVDGGERLLWGANPDGVWRAEDAISAYMHLWEDINNPRGYCAEDNALAWAANPWVWALTFRRVATGSGIGRTVGQCRSQMTLIAESSSRRSDKARAE